MTDILRQKFVEQFGEETAQLIEHAALVHSGFMAGETDGTFRRCLSIAIGFQCMSDPYYRAWHGIVTPWTELKTWIKENAHITEKEALEADPIALICGSFDGLLVGN